MRPARVLIVDDNAVLRILLAQLVECAGFEAIPVDSGEAALEVARADPPDVCLVDQLMPGMSGAELIRALRSSPDERVRHIPAIGVSALSGADRELMEAGAVAALHKPLTEGPLLDGLRRALPPEAFRHSRA
jgi:two-component system, OmpR family, phosphate regulon response regulator PhoB